MSKKRGPDLGGDVIMHAARKSVRTTVPLVSNKSIAETPNTPTPPKSPFSIGAGPPARAPPPTQYIDVLEKLFCRPKESTALLHGLLDTVVRLHGDFLDPYTVYVWRASIDMRIPYLNVCIAMWLIDIEDAVKNRVLELLDPADRAKTEFAHRFVEMLGAVSNRIAVADYRVDNVQKMLYNAAEFCSETLDFGNRAAVDAVLYAEAENTRAALRTSKTEDGPDIGFYNPVTDVDIGRAAARAHSRAHKQN